MFRTVIINSGEKISIQDNWLIIESGQSMNRIPVGDIYSVVLDNQNSSITVPTIHTLTDAGAHILVCNRKHEPVSVILPQNTHYHPLTVIRKQIAMTDSFKDALWDQIVKAKIVNQAQVMSFCMCEKSKYERVLQLADEVYEGDIGNREGIAAKMFFRSLYGASFVRMADDAINAALNYGYTVIRSAFCKTLCAYGYNCVIGIHHINEANPFNLADDLMEPLRPIVDMWVDENHEDMVDELTKHDRAALSSLVNEYVLIDNKKMKVRNAIDLYVRSLTSCMNNGTVDLLVTPTIIPFELYNAENND